MRRNIKKFIIFTLILPFVTFSYSIADTTDIKEILEIIQKDLRTLERAVYSESFSQSSNNSSTKNSCHIKLFQVQKSFQ